jgi:Ca2+-dependent lipid-binding protein
MDPFCLVEYRQQKFKTAVKQNAGKTPVWNQTYDIDVKYIGDDMTVKVFDEDVTDNDAIGAVMLKASSLCIPGGMDEWFTITYKGKSAGQVHLKSTWTPMGQSANAGAAQNIMGSLFGAPAQQQIPQGYGQPSPAQMGYVPPMGM